MGVFSWIVDFIAMEAGTHAAKKASLSQLRWSESDTVEALVLTDPLSILGAPEGASLYEEAASELYHSSRCDDVDGQAAELRAVLSRLSEMDSLVVERKLNAAASALMAMRDR